MEPDQKACPGDEKLEEGPPGLSEKELKELALAFMENKVFSMAHIPDNRLDLLPLIFMTVALGAYSDKSPAYVANIGNVYEYYDKRLPRSINGFPTFASHHHLNVADWTTVRVMIGKLEKAREAALEAL